MDPSKFEFVVEYVDEMGEAIHNYTFIEEDAKADAKEFYSDDQLSQS